MTCLGATAGYEDFVSEYSFKFWLFESADIGPIDMEGPLYLSAAKILYQGRDLLCAKGLDKASVEPAYSSTRRVIYSIQLLMVSQIISPILAQYCCL